MTVSAWTGSNAVRPFSQLAGVEKARPVEPRTWVRGRDYLQRQ